MQFMPSKSWKKLIIEALMDKLYLLRSIMAYNSDVRNLWKMNGLVAVDGE